MDDDDALALSQVQSPLSVPCVVCGCERLYVLETPAPLLPRWQGLFRRCRVRRVRVSHDIRIGRGYPMAGVIRQVAREVAQSAFDDPSEEGSRAATFAVLSDGVAAAQHRGDPAAMSPTTWKCVRWRDRPAAHGTAKKVVPRSSRGRGLSEVMTA
jgi:hypothetical protein